MGEAGYAEPALGDRDLALAVARHKTLFFAEKNAAGQSVDYEAAVTGALRLVPEGRAQEVLADDYRRMVEDGLLLDDAEPLEALIEGCRELERKANA